MLRACMLHVADVRRAWISGHPREKAPTVDRTGPGMAWAWRGRACYHATNYRYGRRSAWAQGLGQQARRQRQKLRRREGLRRQHIILRLAEDGRMMMARQAEGEAARYRQESRAAAQYGMQYAAIGS